MLIDVLTTPRTSIKALRLLVALAKGAPGDVREFKTGKPREGAWLVVYGLGGADRVGYAKRGRLLAFDMGYWDRKSDDRKYRVSVEGFHCPGRIMQGPMPSADRWNAAGLSIAPDHRSDGPILLIGNSPKSNAVGADGWSAAKSRELRESFPGRTVLYRQKPGRPIEPGVKCDGIADGPIDQVIAGASLVVCRHSNVAVDACRLGVPVVTEDGAAAAIYPRDLDDAEMQPTFEQRTEFLHRLAWWQWSPSECASGMFWRWFKETIA